MSFLENYDDIRTYLWQFFNIHDKWILNQVCTKFIINAANLGLIITRYNITKQKRISLYDYAIKINSLSLLKYAVENKHKPTEEIDEINNLEMFIWLYEIEPDKCINNRNAAAVNGKLDILKYIHNKKPISDIKISSWGAFSGNVELFEWFKCNNLLSTNDLSVMKHAIQCGHLDLIKWLYKYGYSLCEISYAAKYPEIIIWMREQNCPWDNKITESASLCNNLDLLKILDKSLFSDNTLYEGVYSCSIETFKWLSEYRCKITSEITSRIILYSRIDLLELIDIQYWPDDSMFNAIKSGSLEIANYVYSALRDKNKENIIPINAGSIAIEHDDFEMIKWLHAHNYDISNVYDGAIMNNNVELLEWMSDQKLIIIKSAQDCELAAEYGNLKVLKLFAHLEYPMSNKLFQKFIDSYGDLLYVNYMKILNWLYKNNYTYHPKALTKAIQSEFIDIIKWIINRYPITIENTHAAFVAKNDTIIDLLFEYKCPLDSYSLDLVVRHCPKYIQHLLELNIKSDTCIAVLCSTNITRIHELCQLLFQTTDQSKLKNNTEFMKMVSSHECEIYAIRTCNEDIIKWLLSFGYKFSYNLTNSCIVMEKYDLFEYLMENNITWTYRTCIHVEGKNRTDLFSKFNNNHIWDPYSVQILENGKFYKSLEFLLKFKLKQISARKNA